MHRGRTALTLAALAASLLVAVLAVLGTGGGIGGVRGATKAGSAAETVRRATARAAGGGPVSVSGGPAAATRSSPTRLVALGRPGRRASKPSVPGGRRATRGGTPAGGSVARMLYDATGYTPSQVTSEPVCATATAGEVSCDAERLVTRDGHAAVHTLVSPDGSGAATVCETTTTAPQCAPKSFSPSLLQEAYDTGWLSANGGVGKTVAIVDAYDDPDAASDLATFRSGSGLPVISASACTPSNITSNDSGTPCFVKVSQTGSTSSLPNGNSGWASEESLDVDAVSSLCPNCNILLVEAKSSADSNLEAADEEAIRLGAKLVSNSFGGPASGDGDAFSDAEANAGTGNTGSETFASTGDDGAYADDGYTSQGQSSADQVPYPASEPGITAVGGTELDQSSGTRGFSERAWSSSEGAAGSACSQFDSQPSWQADIDTGCSGRAVSDISADADPDTGLQIYDTYGENGWVIYGGTSLAAPLTAAFTAITAANSGSTANSNGSLSAEWAYADASKLNDVTAGDNGTCPANTSYAPYQTCNSGPGWDGPTGVGSISGVVVAGGPSLTMPPDDGLVATENVNSTNYSDLQALSSTGATFQGGAYPNGSSTSVWWEYGTDSATSSGTDFSSAVSTSSQGVGNGTTPAETSASVTGLTPNTTYYAEECAQNSVGQICGNVMEFTTPSGTTLTPDTSDLPTVSDTNPLTPGQYTVGDTLSASTGGWLNSGSASFSYQWYDGSTAISGATSSTYQLAAADVGKNVSVTVTAGGRSAASSSIGPVVAVAAPAQGRTVEIWDTSLGLGGTITLDAPTWSPGAASVSYQWQESSNGSSGWTNIGGPSATNSPYTIALADSQQYVRAAVTATNSAGSATAYSSAVLVQNLTPSASGGATLSDTGLGYGGQISVASAPTWAPGSPTVTYQWQESASGTGGWSNLGSSTSSPSTYTIGVNDSQQYIRVAITATDAAGSATVYSGSVQVQSLAPAPNGSATITDTSLDLGGQISLSSSPSWAPGSPTVTYQWQESTDDSTWSGLGTADPSLSPYTIQAADSQDYIRAQIVATDSAGSTTAYSNVVQVHNLAPAASNPTLSDTSLGYGGQISAPTPTWSPAATSVSYQWQESANGTSGWTNFVTASGTNSPYTIALADSQQYIRLEVTGTNGSGSTTIYSNALRVQDLAPVASGNPTISGGSALGDALGVVTTPSWSPGSPSVSDQWQESGNGTGGWTNIGGATSTSYTIQITDSALYIRLAVTASDAAGTTTAYSNSIQADDFLPQETGSATISAEDGDLELGGVLSVDDELVWSGASTVAEQWQESSDDSSWTDISGATSDSYTIRPGDSQQYIRLEISGTNGAGSTPFATNVLQVDNLRPAAAGPSLLDPDLGLGGQLSIGALTWSPEPTTVSYQWQTSADDSTWSDIGGATSPGYTIQLGDSRQYLRLAVTGTNGSGATTVDSDSAQVDNLTPVASGDPSLSDNGLGLGDVIGIGTTAPTWSPGTPSVMYQWQESSDGAAWTNINGATGSSYTIQAADSQNYVRVELVASDAAGSATVYSNAVQVQNLTPSQAGTGNSDGGSQSNSDGGSQSNSQNGSQGGDQPVTISGPLTLSGGASVGARIAIGGGFSAGSGSGSVSVTFKRCAHTCTTVQTGSATDYTLRAADAGYFLVAYVAAAGEAPVPTSMVGPIASPAAGSLKITRSSGTVRSSRRVALLGVRRALVKPKKRGKPSTDLLTLTRVAKLKGSISAWACLMKAGKLVSCTRAVNVSRTARLSEPVGTGESVEVVAVR